MERIKSEGKHLTTYSIEDIPESPPRTQWKTTNRGIVGLGLTPEARDVVFLLAMGAVSLARRQSIQVSAVRGLRTGQFFSGRGLRSVTCLSVAKWGFGLSTAVSCSLLGSRKGSLRARLHCTRAATIKWLEEEAPDYWRRSHLWLLQQDDGDENPLLEGSDRRWRCLRPSPPAIHWKRSCARATGRPPWAAAIERPDFPDFCGSGRSRRRRGKGHVSGRSTKVVVCCSSWP